MPGIIDIYSVQHLHYSKRSPICTVPCQSLRRRKFTLIRLTSTLEKPDIVLMTACSAQAVICQLLHRTSAWRHRLCLSILRQLAANHAYSASSSCLNATTSHAYAMLEKKSSANTPTRHPGMPG
jgi:hypothetical protein